MIVLRTKEVEFDVTYINLREKPDWFLKISPHGKVPVLKVDDEILFESNAIAEYLDETVLPQLHPADPIKRARNRAWTDFVPDFSKGLSAAYRRDTLEEMEEGRADAKKVLGKLEDAIKSERINDGPYFNGDTLCLVDAAYAPFLQRFMIAEANSDLPHFRPAVMYARRKRRHPSSRRQPVKFQRMNCWFGESRNG